MANWFEDDSFWKSFDRFFFSQFRSSEITSAEAENIIRLLEPSAGVAILHLCCGPGRHPLGFARRGFRMTGVDRTARYLEDA